MEPELNQTQAINPPLGSKPKMSETTAIVQDDHLTAGAWVACGETTCPSPLNYLISIIANMN